MLHFIINNHFSVNVFFLTKGLPVAKQTGWEVKVSFSWGERSRCFILQKQFRNANCDIITWAQASLVSELSRFEAELDSDIMGLEKTLSQKKQQRRGWGEVLSTPPTPLCPKSSLIVSAEDSFLVPRTQPTPPISTVWASPLATVSCVSCVSWPGWQLKNHLPVLHVDSSV